MIAIKDQLNQYSNLLILIYEFVTIILIIMIAINKAPFLMIAIKD